MNLINSYRLKRAILTSGLAYNRVMQRLRHSWDMFANDGNAQSDRWGEMTLDGVEGSPIKDENSIAGSGVYLNGSSAYRANSGNVFTWGFGKTFQVSFKCDTDKTSDHTIFHIGNSTAGQGYLVKIKYDTGAISISNYGSSATWGSGYCDGSWHWLVIVHKLNTCSLADLEVYVDGVEIVEAGLPTSPTVTALGSNYLTVGRTTGYADYFKGSLDSLRFWNTWLGADQIEALRVAGTADNDPPSINGYDFGHPSKRNMADYGQWIVQVHESNVSHSINTWTEATVACVVNLHPSDEGIIWEVGGATYGTALVLYNGGLYVRGGNVNSTGWAETSWVGGLTAGLNEYLIEVAIQTSTGKIKIYVEGVEVASVNAGYSLVQIFGTNQAGYGNMSSSSYPANAGGFGSGDGINQLETNGSVVVSNLYFANSLPDDF